MKTFAKYLALIAVLAFFMTPIVWTAITAIKPTELISSQPIVWTFKPTLDHFRVIFLEDNILTPLLNSTIIAVLSTLGVLITAAPASYALSRFRVPFGPQIASYFLSARMAPPVTVVLPLFLLFRSFNLIDTHAALISAYITVNMPFAIWMIKGFFDEIPKELDEAALLDGCSRFHAFLRIVLPLTRAWNCRDGNHFVYLFLERVPVCNFADKLPRSNVTCRRFGHDDRPDGALGRTVRHRGCYLSAGRYLRSAGAEVFNQGVHFRGCCSIIEDR